GTSDQAANRIIARVYVRMRNAHARDSASLVQAARHSSCLGLYWRWTAVRAVIDAYLDHLRVERRLAEHTLESYARDLGALAAFAAAAGAKPEQLDRHALEEFVRQQRARGLAPRSVARLVASVRGFYRFLVLDQRLPR